MTAAVSKRAMGARDLRDKKRGGFGFYAVFFLLYSLFFLIGAVLIYVIFHGENRTFLWGNDGVYQHFSAFHYVCDSLESLLSGTSSSIQPFNYTLGQGSDILTTLNSYDFTDPISWLCALLPLSRLTRYTVMIFIKLWLSGAMFSVYCFVTDRRDRAAVLSGALSYVFSGALVYVFARHPNYVNWAYFLPLLFAGAELYRRKGKKYLLILSVALNIVVSFYTFFINAVLLVIYVVTVSLCNIIRERKKGVFLAELWLDVRTAVLCVLGAMAAAAVLLPTIYAFLHNPRTGELTGYTESALYFEIDGDKAEYYKQLLNSIFMPYTTVDDFTTYIGLLPVALPCVILLFTQRKKGTHLKALFVLFAVMMCVPLAGRVLNGMGYATNRWAYAIPFVCGVIITEVIPMLSEMKFRHKLIAFVIGAAYIAVCLLMSDIEAGTVKDATMIALAVSLVFFLLLSLSGPRVSRVSSLVMVVLCSVFAIAVTFLPGYAAYVETYRTHAEADHVFDDSSSAVGGLSTADNFFRVESKELRTNSNGVNKVNGTDMWWSMMPESTYDYYNTLELGSVHQNCNFRGLDSRSALLELASVRYYTMPEGGAAPAPAGFALNESLSTDEYDVYENENALPIAYTYSKYITRESFDALPAVEKQEALMQAAVLEEPHGRIAQADPEFSSYKVSYNLVGTSGGVTLGDNAISVTRGGASLTFSADIPKDCEIYLRLGGIEIDAYSNALIEARRTVDGADFAASTNVRVSNLSYAWYVPREGAILNLGVGGEGRNTITLTSVNRGEYTFDAIELYAVPLSSYTAQASELGRYTLQNTYVDSTRIEGDIELPEERLLQFSVPYSDGFKAYIDGVETDVFRSDVMYMAITVPEGSHHIEVRYTTPYLLAGVLVSAATVLGLIAYELIRRRVRKSARG